MERVMNYIIIFVPQYVVKNIMIGSIGNIQFNEKDIEKAMKLMKSLVRHKLFR